MRQKKQTYDYLSFWNEKKDIPKFSNQKYLNVLNELKKLDFKSVLEIGSGQGELTRLIMDNFPIEKIECVDISSRFLVQIPHSPILKRTLCDFLYYDTQERFDLVIASHFLLHIEPANLKLAWDKMCKLSKKYIVHIDPIKDNIHRKWDYYNFPHDYNQLHSGAEFKQVEKYSGIWLVVNPF